MTALYAVIGAVIIAGGGLWVIVRLARAAARAETERDVLEVDHAKQAAADEILAGPLLTGHSLRARMRARLRKAQSRNDPTVPDADDGGD